MDSINCITFIDIHSQEERDRNNQVLNFTIMANTVCLDHSAHSISTPPQEMEPPLSSTPLSPNGVDDYAKDSTLKVSASTTKTTTDATLQDVAKNLTKVLPCAPSCASTYATETDTFSAVSSLSATLHTSTKSVQFSPRVRVKDTLSRHEMTEEERTDYWLQDEDFLMIKKRNQETILATLESQKSAADENDTEDSSQQQHEQSSIDITDEEEYCLRGLEAGLPTENLRRRSYRFAALEEVLLEQEDQYFAGIYDEEAISEVCMEVTVECRFRAEFRAMQDAKQVEEYLNQEPKLAFPKATPYDGEEDDEFALE